MLQRGILYIYIYIYRTAHSNAYFYGFWKYKRIVLFDTLIDKYSIEENIAILSHELGHWKFGHNIKNILISLSYLFSVFYLFSIVKDNADLFISFGFKEHSVYIYLFIVLYRIS